MSDSPKTPERQDSNVDSLIAQLLCAADAGKSIDHDAFLQEHPDVATELQEFFAAATLVERLAGPKIDEATRHNSVAQRDLLHQRLGRYQIERVLGEGAMGTVYLASDTELQRRVALKVPKLPAEEHAEWRERFSSEGRAAAALRSPNICPVYDVSEVDGVVFITMPFIEGESLTQRADRYSQRRLPNNDAVAFVCKLAKALSKAHEQGIVHRDLKPGNVMLDADNEPIVMDFGLARDVRQADSQAGQSGMIVGSPAYMAPEQVDNDLGPVGPAADIYGLGIVLYELLTGQTPFQGNTLEVLGKTLVSSPPPPSSLNPDIDASLEAICLKMIRKPIAERYPDMTAVATALETYLDGLGVQERSAIPRSGWFRWESVRFGLPVFATVALFGLVVAAVLWMVWPRSAAIIDARGSVKGMTTATKEQALAPHEVRRFLGHEDPVRSLALSHDGTRLISGDAEGSVTFWDIPSGRLVHSTHRHVGLVTSIAISPDDRSAISGGADQTIRLWDVGTGQQLRQFVGHVNEVSAVSFAPGGDRFCSGSYDGQIRLWDINQSTTNMSLGYRSSSEAPQVRTLDDVRQLDGHITWVRSVVFSHDGLRIFSSGNEALIAIWDVQSGRIVGRLIGHVSPVLRLALSPDGHTIVSGAYDGSIRVWDADTGQLKRTMNDHTGPIFALAVSLDNQFVFSGSADATIRCWNMQSDVKALVLAGHEGNVNAVINGSQFGSVLSGGDDRTIRLWQIDVEENNER